VSTIHGYAGHLGKFDSPCELEFWLCRVDGGWATRLDASSQEIQRGLCCNSDIGENVLEVIVTVAAAIDGD